MALSRCRTLEGIELTAPIPLTAIRVSDKIDAFIDYCHNNLKNPKELLKELSGSDNVQQILQTLNAIAPTTVRKKLEGEELNQLICEQVEQKKPVGQILEQYDVSVREFTSTVLALLYMKKFRLRDIIQPETLSYLQASFAATPKMKITDRIKELYGKAKSYEVRWYDEWNTQQQGFFRLE